MQSFKNQNINTSGRFLCKTYVKQITEFFVSHAIFSTNIVIFF
nr:MAG TPA: hypothetical protein [Caudoviricetes sp.]